MKRVIFLLVIITASASFSNGADAQLFKKLKNVVKEKVENQIVNDAGNIADKSVDKTEDAVINSANKKNKNTETAAKDLSIDMQRAASTDADTSKNDSPTEPIVTAASYKNYDFVPGEKIIFTTDFKDQQDAELPARLQTLHGNAEIQTYKGDNILHLGKGSNVCVMPSIDSFSYLPDQFTVEFDFMYEAPDPTSFNQIEVDFYKPGKEDNYVVSNYGEYHFLIYEADQIDFGKSVQGKSLPKYVADELKTPGKWHHIAIYVHGDVGKAYIDQYRVAASNTMMKGAGKLAIKTNGRIDYFVKNLRIAGGGSDAYHKIMTEGKLVTHGIHFASGKAHILPESMGTINEVYKILKDHPDLKFEIDGYTDNDGSADLNLKLSQKRADAVKNRTDWIGYRRVTINYKRIWRAETCSQQRYAGRKSK